MVRVRCESLTGEFCRQRERVRYQGEWICPTAFETAAGSKRKKWKESIKVLECGTSLSAWMHERTTEAAGDERSTPRPPQAERHEDVVAFHDLTGDSSPRGAWEWSDHQNAEIVDVSSLSYEDLIHRVPVMSEAVEPGIGSTEPRGLNYVSLFSGLESGGQALLKLKMPWNLLICVENDPHAQGLLKERFPADPAKRTKLLCSHLYDGERYIGPRHVVHWCDEEESSGGDIQKLSNAFIEGIVRTYGKIQLVGCGWPCNGVSLPPRHLVTSAACVGESGANPYRQGLGSPSSNLFNDAIDISMQIRVRNGGELPLLLFENVCSMKKESFKVYNRRLHRLMENRYRWRPLGA